MSGFIPTQMVSLLDFTQVDGARVFCNLFSFHVGSHTTHFDGKIEAIHLALHQLSARLCAPDKASILSYSSSVIQASASNQDKSFRVQNCRELLSRIPTKVVFQSVLSHCGFWRNKMADLSAKRGRDILQRSTGDLPLYSTKLEINSFKNCFQDAATSAAKNKSGRVLIKPNCVSDSPRAAAVDEFRLLTGHDYL
ncbi:hypothetical protein TNCV_4133351 [Trichonephila clavipes]|uniref:RNase H type-1 domain-containing protein n=1 Tax=Trichonephila clavipes TaxID=2585209 RepID=A0A8X6SAD2_TRICX|nr:hypothetical protein TNCV_4133351 [Trichonephila clavipes]